MSFLKVPSAFSLLPAVCGEAAAFVANSSVCTINNNVECAGASLSSFEQCRGQSFTCDLSDSAFGPNGNSLLYESEALHVRGLVRERLRNEDNRFTKEEIERMDERFHELHDHLLRSAVVIGRDERLRLEFDPGEETAALWMQEHRVFRIGPRFLLQEPTDKLTVFAMHEGGHADIDRVGSGFFFRTSSLKALWNVIADIRVNARVMDRASGRAEEMKEVWRERYSDASFPSETMELFRKLPHEAFLEGAMSREYSGVSRWDQDPLVGPALDEAWDAIQDAKAVRPKESYPDEMTVQKSVAKFERVVRDRILPVYERLYQESLKYLEKRLQEDAGNGAEELTVGDVGGGGTSSTYAKNLSEVARRMVEGRAGKIASDHAPTGTMGSMQDKAGDIFGQAEHSDKVGSGEEKTGADSVFDSGTLMHALHRRHHNYQRHQQRLQSFAYSRHLSALGRLPDQVFQVFDQLLNPNTDFEFDGWFASGPRVDVERAVAAIHGMYPNLNVFQRKVEPSGKTYRFSLELDASGSMVGHRELGGLGMAALFTDVFERLDFPYALGAFHSSDILLKGFDERMRTVGERNAKFNYIETNVWGHGGTNICEGISAALGRIREARKTDPREQEFLFVLTDGDEMQGDSSEIRVLCDEAMKEGIIVVGIGIGRGMALVRKYFPSHLVEHNPLKLPQLLAEFIRVYIKATMDED